MNYVLKTATILAFMIVPYSGVANADFLLPSPLGEWCYQESADHETACGGRDGGEYSVIEFTPFCCSSYWKDANWDYLSTVTWNFYPSQPSDTWDLGSLLVSYNKPQRALPTSLLKVKDHVRIGDAYPTQNEIAYPIPTECFKEPILSFRFTGPSDINYADSVTVHCQAGGTWIPVHLPSSLDHRGTETVMGLIEEAMIWDMAKDKKQCKPLEHDSRKACERAFKKR